MTFVTQSAADLHKKVLKKDGFSGKNRSELLETAKKKKMGLTIETTKKIFYKENKSGHCGNTTCFQHFQPWTSHL